ncbi:MAG: sigma 54-interacting transcriptional regulator [Pseudomonas sp.]
MFAHMPEPLNYAEALLECFGRLASMGCRERLLGGLVEAIAELSGCQLSQLYLLDETHTRLTLCAEFRDGALQPLSTASVPSDYNDAHLLQYCLCQNQILNLASLDNSLYATDFLPEASRPWRSLLCQPLLNEQGHVSGLLLCASHFVHDMQHFTRSFGHLGRFVIAQLHLLQNLHQDKGRAAADEAKAQSPVSQIPKGYGLIGDSPAMRSVYQLIGKVLHSPVSVMITGETGTGKELVAQAIHHSGFRRSKPFVVQNCASIPENLLESELFGYRKGAFSGADRDRKGLFDAADGGTLFLDEIGDMPLSLQAKLLRVLQEGEVRPLGSTETHKVDVRIIAATHCDLRSQAEQGRFREDLFYRLSHFPIDLPPLRDRGEDIMLLARHFTTKACNFLERPPRRWSDQAVEHLLAYDFPGNVRELKGLVERAVLLCDGAELLPEHFNLEPASSAVQLNLRERMEQVERNLLIDCLRKNQGNQTNAANELGLPRRTLLYRMQRLNICPAELKASKDKNTAQAGRNA